MASVEFVFYLKPLANKSDAASVSPFITLAVLPMPKQASNRPSGGRIDGNKSCIELMICRNNARIAKIVLDGSDNMHYIIFIRAGNKPSDGGYNVITRHSMSDQHRNVFLDAVKRKRCVRDALTTHAQARC